MTRVWVTGAAGMLGREVCSALAAREMDFIGTDRELDITSQAAVDTFAEREAFTHVINCAAYTGVDACEAHEEEALRVNADGPAHLARAAARRGAIAVHVSTDYVFPGDARATPYTEDDATGPINAYGRTKLAGERAFLAALPTGHVVRTSWLFGDGPNFVATMLRLFAEKPHVNVVGDQVGRPTYAPDLAAAVVGVAVRQPAAGIYQFANAGHVSWFQFAAAIHAEARARGRTVVATLGEITTAQYPTPARRPAYSVLATAKLERAIGITPRPWREALVAYLEATP